MHPIRPIALFLVSLSMGMATASASASDTAAMSTLKEKGLSKSGTTYVIEDEKPVLDKLKEVKAAYAGYSQVAGRKAAQEQMAYDLVLLGQQQAMLQQQLNGLNQQMSSQRSSQPYVGGRMGRMARMSTSSQNAPMIAQRNQIQAMLSQVSMGQKSLKAQVPQAKDKAALAAEVSQKLEAFKTALGELRPMVDDVTKKYADLEVDDAVKKAKIDLHKTTNANIKLGPSDALKAGEKYLDRAERQFLGKKSPAASKKKASSKSKK